MSASDLICIVGLGVFALIAIWQISRQQPRPKLRAWEPPGSGDFRRALHYKGVAPSMLGKENIGLPSDDAKREGRRS